MAKKINRLNSLFVKRETNPGWYPDGQGLYLQVSPSGTKSWVYRYTDYKKERRHGLGAYPVISLDRARREAAQCRELRASGIDPITHKKDVRKKLALEAANVKTFSVCASAYINDHKSAWKNPKHELQWKSTLKTYADPIIGDVPVNKIETEHISLVLKPIWETKTETASRVRQRIEAIIDWATVKEYREGDNPARWKGHLDKLLPDKGKIQKVRHFPAMPYSELPKFYSYIRSIDTVAAKALAFIILTATRSNETRKATPSEIKNDMWIISEQRMKASAEHRVPLTNEALKILNELKGVSTDNYIFPGLSGDKPISDAALLKLLKATHPTLTVHGFRSTFRDWCAETTSHPREVAEAALAHTLKDKTEAAYQRGDLFKKRKKLMEDWTKYCFS